MVLNLVEKTSPFIFNKFWSLSILQTAFLSLAPFQPCCPVLPVHTFCFFYILVLPQIQNRSTPLLSLFSIFYLLYNRTALLFPHPFLCCFFRIFSVFPLPATKYNLVIPAYIIFFLCPFFLPPYRLATPSFLYSPFSLYHFPVAITTVPFYSCIFLSLFSGTPIQPHKPVIPSSIYLFPSAHSSSRIYLFSSTFSTDPSCRHTTPIFLHTPLFSLFFRDPIATVSFYSCIFLSLFSGTPNRTDLSFLPLFSLSFFPPPAEITPLCYSCIYLLFSL